MEFVYILVFTQVWETNQAITQHTNLKNVKNEEIAWIPQLSSIQNML